MKTKTCHTSLTNDTCLPPQAPDMEQAVLGALLLEPAAAEAVEGILHPDDFYLPANQLVFQAMSSLRTTGRPVDLLTVTEELLRRKELDRAGGPFYLSQLASQIGSSAHVGYHARVVRDKSVARRLIRIASEVLKRAYDPANDIAEVIEYAEGMLTGLAVGSTGSVSVTLGQVLQQAVQHAARMEELRKSGRVAAIPTGLSGLDKLLSGGWHAPNLIVLGARPSMGKTQAALTFARAAGEAGYHVCIVSIEMLARQLGTRFVLEDERISPDNLYGGQLSDEEWKAIEEQVAAMRDLPICIAGDADIRNLHTICSEARRLKRRGELDLLIIDYLTLIRTGRTFGHRYQEIGYITGELKNLAKELAIPVILISQLNRPAKLLGPVPAPKLEDLRESGDIEQDADIVIFLHRPAYYNPDSIDSNGIRWEGRGKFLIAKQREGPRNVETIFYHDKQFKKFGNRPF